MKSVCLSFFTFLTVVIAVAAMEPGKGFNCVKAKLSLLPCLEFVLNNTQTPSTACCKVITEIKASASTKDELRATCQCFQETITQIPNLNFDRVQAVPKLCKIDVGFPITKDFNCSKIA